MCGICGIIDPLNRLEPSDREGIVVEMATHIIHRGPDDDGFHHDLSCSMAMRRLSIIDKGGGKQPIYSPEGNLCILFNGEIYNYLELRRELEVDGYPFKTFSDTEVLLGMYHKHGRSMLAKLKGMFAFVIYDNEKSTWFLARDRFGEKPLYYHFNNSVFTFSSEIKSLLAFPQVPRKLNMDSLPYYFRTSLVPEPMTMFKDIYSLPAGHCLTLNNDGIKIEQYFSNNYSKNNECLSEAEALISVREKLESSVKRQTVSDVPIGAFLSGGIDSSTIVALLQKQSIEKIKTFTVKFEGDTYDESKIAKAVSQHLGTEHTEVVLPSFTFNEDTFWEIINHIGLPFRDSSAIPMYHISQRISKYIKVALSGDGGDELFGGYDVFQWYRKIKTLKKLPKTFRKVAQGGVGALSRIGGIKLDQYRKLTRGIETSYLPEKMIPISLSEMFSESEVDNILENKSILEKHSAYEALQAYPENFNTYSDLRKIMHFRLNYTLPSNMLIKVDRMSMAHSLETRAPFLDPDVFDVSLKLADDLLIKGGKGKYIIRKMMEEYLPSEVFDHPKQGFNLPLHNFRNDAYRTLAIDLLFENNPWEGFFNSSVLKEIYQDGIANEIDGKSIFRSTHQLYMLMQLLGWARAFKVQL